MFGFFRLVLILFVGLTLVYLAVSLYSREVRRAKLRRRWQQKGLTGDRAAFIQRGLRQYDRSFRRKLILLVYIIPLGALMLLVYVINFM
ncbi:hypothetical protein [Phaeobacter italicus]|jgi:hypothetical protein|uniref:Cation/multidrug efflux pump n=1 Tax=Phaeobacter italicus TaxID=481446 RepID=A0A0H5D789_9RHOB|nr:hypothetical protein [Phaeobacter italicus]EEB71121.1 conserved hypothetical protein [Ruegeria sp. R11]NKX72520.1 hypothetical protein [Rhodobacteraceae bacterium R_SAG1]MBO9442697.1 hypothetical protein [Phaeobacter italicus]MBY6043982.1 hypothetical protein [Phaeobacter italicus]MCI5099312.1 hypothetical protein [Phaeobacter italicus]